jgi:glycosyltransferase involved in cell wall biosynthesis
MEVYARELIGAMRELPDAPRLTVFVGTAAAEAGEPWIDALDPVVVPVDARNRVQWVRGEQQLLPPLARKAGVDLVHSLASTAPLWGRFKRVTTVHDLIYLVHPEAHFGVLALGMRALVGQAVRRSQRVIAVSESTGHDLQERLHVAPAKIDVIPNGVLPAPAGPPADVAAVRARYDLGDREVLLAASAKRPHKNLPRLLDAVASLAPPRRPLLVLPGYPTEHEAELRARAARLGIEGDVRFLGWLSAAELEGLYAVAAGFVMPSLYEGFGLPVLEAMARGVPVACADRSSLPEVAGDAALLFDPESVPEMAACIDKLLHDRGTAERLRAAGPAQAAKFSWRRAAEQTVVSYGRTLGYHRPSGN